MKMNGVNGMVLKAHNPERLSRWYEENLGLVRDRNGTFLIPTEIVPYDTSYFSPTIVPSQLNFHVSRLAPLLKNLEQKGIPVDEPLEESEYGRFAWLYDPEGNRIELWEPPQQESLINLPEAE